MRDKLQKVAIASTAVLSLLTPVLAQTDYSYSSSTDDGAGAFVLVMYCCLCIFSLLFLGLQIYLIIDALGRDFGSDNSMLIVSIVLLVFLGFPVGTIVYYFLVMKKYPKKAKGMAAPVTTS
jgi:hypothetical protein